MTFDKDWSYLNEYLELIIKHVNKIVFKNSKNSLCTLSAFIHVTSIYQIY